MKKLIYVLVALLISACASQGPRRADMPLISEADGRIAENDYAGAAQIYRRLAEESDAPDYYRLQAAEAELRSGNSRSASALMGEIEPDELRSDDRNRYWLLRARGELNRGNAQEAMSILDDLNYQRLDPDMGANYHTLKASAYNQLGNMLDCARERVALGELLSAPEAIAANNEAIYDALNRLSDRALAELQPPPPDVLGGWMALTQILRDRSADRSPAITQWETRFPDHPADSAFIDRIATKRGNAKYSAKGDNSPPSGAAVPARVTPLADSGRPPVSSSPSVAGGDSRGNLVGVLLPLSGSYAVAGQAIKTGMEAAKNADGSAGKPALEYVDSNGQDVSALYGRLVEKGARQIVGPLIKEDIAALARSPNLNVPILALNQNAEVNSESIYQFGLTPEQEVEQIAGSAWFDNKQSALVMAPASAFGQRMINHFSSYWRSLGGKLVSVKTYRAGGDDFSNPARALLESAASAGNSADFVFLVADVRDGSLLKPYLEAQQRSNPVPVYAMSQIFNGRADAPQNPDLSGVVFCDIPWFLNGSGGAVSSASLRGAIDQTPEPYRRLIAMGIDAYRLLPELSRMGGSSQERFEGSTGVLSLDEGRRVLRQLQCAQFEAGGIRSRGLAPLLKAGAPAQSAAQGVGSASQ